MAKPILVDTDVMDDFLRGHPKAVALVRRHAALGDQDLGGVNRDEEINQCLGTGSIGEYDGSIGCAKNGVCVGRVNVGERKDGIVGPRCLGWELAGDEGLGEGTLAVKIGFRRILEGRIDGVSEVGVERAALAT